MSKAHGLQRRRILATAALAALALGSVLKGYEHEVQTWGIYYWWMDYAFGFTKRGLLGTVFQHLVASGDAQADLRRVWMIHAFACGALVLLLLAHAQRMLLAASSASDVYAVGLAWGAFFASQFLATTSNLVGFTDVYLMLAFVGIADLLRTRRYAAAAAAGFLVPFVHEGFTFLWTSAFVVLVFEIATEATARRRRVVVAVAPFLGAAMTALFHSRLSPPAALARAPLDKDTLSLLLGVQFGQSLASTRHYMNTVLATWWVNLLAASAFYLLPNLILVLAGVWWWRQRSRGADARARMRLLVLGVASVSPLLILLLATDLSRFLVWANLACVIAWERLTLAHSNADATAVVAADMAAPGTRTRRRALYTAGVALVVVYTAAPLVVAFFPEAGAIHPYAFQERMVRSALKHYASPAPP